MFLCWFHWPNPILFSRSDWVIMSFKHWYFCETFTTYMYMLRVWNDSLTSGIPAGLVRGTTANFRFSHKLHWLYIFQTSEWYIRTSDFYNPLARQTSAFNLKFRSLMFQICLIAVSTDLAFCMVRFISFSMCLRFSSMEAHLAACCKWFCSITAFSLLDSLNYNRGTPDM